MSSEVDLQFRPAVGAMKDLRVESLTHVRRMPNADAWSTDGPHPTRGGGYDTNCYEDAFGDLLPLRKGERHFHKTLAEILEERPKGRRNVLDLFGGGFFLWRNLQAFDDLIGARLQNVDHYFAQKEWKRYAQYPSSWELESWEKLKLFLLNPKRAMVYGDLYQRRTWNDIRAMMDQRHIEVFDLITCRPEGAFDVESIFRKKSSAGLRLGDLMPIYMPLLDRAYQLLSSNEGHLLAQVPKFYSEEKKVRMNEHVTKRETSTVDEEVIAFMNQLQQVPGVTVVFEENTDWLNQIPYAFHLIKHKDAPESLLM